MRVDSVSIPTKFPAFIPDKNIEISSEYSDDGGINNKFPPLEIYCLN